MVINFDAAAVNREEVMGHLSKLLATDKVEIETDRDTDAKSLRVTMTIPMNAKNKGAIEELTHLGVKAALKR